MHKAADRIRNVALVGHRGSGKTSLHEALLFQAGVVNRLGSVVDGTTVSDTDDDEKARQMSISAALCSFEWQDRKVNLIDTPGDSSFIADALGALRVCESAVFVVNAVMGVEVHTNRLWQRAAELDLARLIFVNMLDRERADFFRTLESLKSAFGQHVVATEIPIGSEHEISRRDRPRRHEGLPATTATGRDNCRRSRSPTSSQAQAEEYREKLMDEVAEASDALMERYLEGEEISHEEIVTTLKEGTNHGALFPVTCGVATRNLGHQPPARRDRRGPPVAGQARRAGDRRGDARARRGRGAVRVRVQDARRPVRRAHQPVPRLPGHDEAGHAAAQHPHPHQGADRPAGHVRGRPAPATPPSTAPATSAPWPSSRRPRPATGWPPATSRSRCRASSSRRR